MSVHAMIREPINPLQGVRAVGWGALGIKDRPTLHKSAADKLLEPKTSVLILETDNLV